MKSEREATPWGQGTASATHQTSLKMERDLLKLLEGVGHCGTRGTRAAPGWLRVVPHGNREASVCLSFWAESLKKEEKPKTLKGPGSGTWFEWEMMI